MEYKALPVIMSSMNCYPQRRGIQPLRLAWLSLVPGLAIMIALVACANEDDIPAQERRAQQLNKVIMCPVCPGESIDQSQNTLASQMRAIVVEKLDEGWTEGKIKEFFVDRYGPSVLLEPPSDGFNLMVWILPPIAIVAAASGLFLALRSMRRWPAEEQDGLGELAELSEMEQDRYVRHIEASLEYEEDSTNRAWVEEVKDPGSRQSIDS